LQCGKGFSRVKIIREKGSTIAKLKHNTKTKIMHKKQIREAWG